MVSCSWRNCLPLVLRSRLLPGGFDASCSGRDAVRFLEELGLITRLTDGMTAKVAKRIADTGAHAAHGDRTAAGFCAQVVGVGTGEAKQAIENAKRLEDLPETDAAVREGRLSAREASLISAVAVHDPSVQAELLAAAGDGLVPLQDACVAARARTEGQAARSKRQHAARSLKMWNNTDGMVEGHFRLTPEVGGPFKTAIEEHTKQVFRGWRAIIKHGQDISTVAHLGRHIPAELRTAMIVSGRECSIEGCTGREYLELDHCEIDHAKGGATARWNLAWLCSVHHRRKTRGWRLGPPDPVTRKRTLDPPGAYRAA